MIGTVINGYKILREIGKGGMATVYYGENNLGRKVALKVLHDEFSKNHDIRSRFKKEADIMMSLDGVKGICQVMDFADRDGQLVIIMEYLEGMTLSRYVKEKGPVKNYAAVRRFCRQVLNALEEAHRLGVIHRDIKPSNLFLTTTGEIKILDFGISKMLFGTDEEATERETTTNQKFGTLSYMSPEQIKCTAEVDKRTDIYSLALTLYYIVTGNDPLEIEEDSWTDITDITLMQAIRHAARKKLDRRTADCRQFLEEIERGESVKKEKEDHPSEQKKEALRDILGTLNHNINETRKPSTKVVVQGNHLVGKTGNPVADRIISNMVYVEGGKFFANDHFRLGPLMHKSRMGNESVVDASGLPVPYPSTMEPFYMSRYFITQKEWKDITGEQSIPGLVFSGDDLPVPITLQSSLLMGKLDEVVEKFIHKLNELSGLNFEIPTEFQWIYAAIGGQKCKGYKYAGSDILDEVAWNVENTGHYIETGKLWWKKTQGTHQPHPVGTKYANELGIYDLMGNAYDLCRTDYPAFDILPHIGVTMKDPKLNAYLCGKGGDFRSHTDLYNIREGIGFMYNYFSFRLVLQTV